ncbi:unnamed protein product [Effrenium voratum]|uniref:Uncharacterized protein n=1 Tax=Effrenium voratum TaxID=2562239 RepID=A0AA36N193_9DINO|nr:unnamed protein product [Effrenium voratum]CAJ1448215.1 unnamed protein product [Effrenium voratum]
MGDCESAGCAIRDYASGTKWTAHRRVLIVSASVFGPDLVGVLAVGAGHGMSALACLSRLAKLSSFSGEPEMQNKHCHVDSHAGASCCRLAGQFDASQCPCQAMRV